MRLACWERPRCAPPCVFSKRDVAKLNTSVAPTTRLAGGCFPRRKCALQVKIGVINPPGATDQPPSPSASASSPAASSGIVASMSASAVAPSAAPTCASTSDGAPSSASAFPLAPASASVEWTSAAAATSLSPTAPAAEGKAAEDNTRAIHFAVRSGVADILLSSARPSPSTVYTEARQALEWDVLAIATALGGTPKLPMEGREVFS
mmetsp:Transcript_54502/g.158336  ORF Transcript_54502/g.158336 Transcript_54502/m.158336 type:complete len:207 (+) Transcript_54502:94-714(+)